MEVAWLNYAGCYAKPKEKKRRAIFTKTVPEIYRLISFGFRTFFKCIRVKSDILQRNMFSLCSCLMSSSVGCWIRLFFTEEGSEDHSKRWHLSVKLYDLTPQATIMLKFRYDWYLTNNTETTKVGVRLLTHIAWYFGCCG